VGFVLALVALSTDPTHTNAGLPTVSSTTEAPRTLAAPAEPVLPFLAPVPAPTTTTTTPPPATAAPRIVPVTAAAASPGPCTSEDLAVTTTTASSFYPTGSPVAVTTQLHVVHSCLFTPAAPAGGCPTDVAVFGPAGNQVAPAPGAAVHCATPGSGLYNQGSSLSVSFTWNGQVDAGGTATAAPPGTYRAVGTWHWSNGGLGSAGSNFAVG